jgi:uncharacterized protein (DUF433 family)
MATLTGRSVYPHILEDKDGVAYIEGTTTRVMEVVEEKNACGVSAEELHLWHPYLSLAQIHAALAYYWDNKDEMDRQMRESETELAQWLQQNEAEQKAFRERILERAMRGVQLPQNVSQVLDS